MCDKEVAELSGELSGVICLKTLVLLGSAVELFRKFFGTVRAICFALGFSFRPMKVIPKHFKSVGLCASKNTEIRRLLFYHYRRGAALIQTSGRIVTARMSHKTSPKVLKSRL